MNVRVAVRRAIELHAAGRLAAAIDAYWTILEQHPDACACWSNLGTALRALGRKDEGLAVLRQGVRVCPDAPEVNYNLGNALADAGDREGAWRHYRAAFVRDPGHLKAARGAGAMLLRLQRFEAAADHYGDALRRHADDPVLHAGLGWALWRLWRPGAAAVLRRAVALDPKSSDFRWRLHQALRWLGRYDEDEEQLRAGLTRNADSPALLAALAQSLIGRGRLDEALACCRAVLAVDPGYENARLARGHANFLAGRYRAAWPDRYRVVKGIDRRPKGTSGREWAGQDLAGESILLYGEQGLGDAIQYARYAPLVAERGARVTVACKSRLVGLLRRLPAVDGVVPADRPPPPTDWHCSLLDVPAAWGHDVDSIPGACPYLPPVRRERPVLRPPRGFRVGIVWAGNPEQKRDRLRSCRLEDFAPLLEMPGTEFVSFQVGERARELRSGWRGLVHDPGDALTGLEATADALLEVDLVITVDTMLAHLAGALGRPVWTLLAFAPDMRWMLGRADTPWYPTMRLFRQPVPGDWAGVFRDVRRELSARLAESGPAPGDTSPPPPATQTDQPDTARELALADVRRAMQLHEAGRLDAAVAAYRAIVQRHPGACVCWSNLGGALLELGREDEALAALRDGVRACPRHAVLNRNLGNALEDAGDRKGAMVHHNRALAHYQAAVEQRPDNARLWHALGWSLWKLRRPEAALAAHRRAIAIDPAPTAYRIDLANTLTTLGRPAENEEQLRAAAPPNADVLAALGHALIDQGRLAAGLEHAEAALAIESEHSHARMARARANFLAGRYAAAWPDYAYRRRGRLRRLAPGAAERVWQGQDLDGQSILLYGEQGLGDVIQFARYAPLVARRGAEVVLCCPPSLAGLLRRLPAVSRVVTSDRPCPPTDWACSLVDVAGVWKTDLDSIPGDCPYLPVRARPRPLLPPTRQFRVGIAWAGSPANDADHRRSCRLDDFAPLVELPGAELVSFQVGRRAADLRESGWQALVGELPDEAIPFDATADALAEVDLVVTVDTSLAHLAGAAGRPVWTLLAHAPDWRWMLARDDTPWYPTMRLFRQPAPNDWAGVFREVRGALAALVAQRGR